MQQALELCPFVRQTAIDRWVKVLDYLKTHRSREHTAREIAIATGCEAHSVPATLNRMRAKGLARSRVMANNILYWSFLENGKPPKGLVERRYEKQKRYKEEDRPPLDPFEDKVLGNLRLAAFEKYKGTEPTKEKAMLRALLEFPDICEA